MRENYKKLGQHEPEDQTDFARHLVNTYDYIDPAHVGVFGWVRCSFYLSCDYLLTQIVKAVFSLAFLLAISFLLCPFRVVVQRKTLKRTLNNDE